MFDSIIKPTAVLFLVCIVVTGALAFTNSVTKDTIAERRQIEEENARMEVFRNADTFKPLDRALEIIEQNEGHLPVKEVYSAYKDGTMVGYIFSVTVKGYGGDIFMTVGIDNEGTITGVNIGENSETPGLGSKATGEEFTSKFINLRPEAKLEIVKTGAKRPEEIDSVSGATISSRAVVEGVQAALDMWNLLKEVE